MLKVPDSRAVLPLIVLVALLGATVPAWAQTPADRSKEVPGVSASDSGQPPQIQFDSMEHDFGQALSGENLSTSFTFKNVGDSVLVIEKVKGG